MHGTFGYNQRVATLSTFYLTISGILIPSLKSIGQFCKESNVLFICLHNIGK